MLLRLDKIIASAGLASRSEIKRLVKQGRITVDGLPAGSSDMKCDPDTAEIRLDGVLVCYSEYHYIMMYKPAGYLSATEDGAGPTVIDLLDGPAKKLGLFPVGRLDKDAEGLLILTDDGDFCHRVISPKSGVVKTYYVETEQPVPATAPPAFAKGLVLADGLHCRPAQLERFGEGECRALVRVTEGKFHQVKRMMAAVGCPVTYLKRIAEGALALDETLDKGGWRYLSGEEKTLVFEQFRA